MNIDMQVVGRIIAVVIGGLFIGLGVAKVYLDYKRKVKKERENRK